MKFTDKHGTPIQAGMTIQHDNGDIEKVYATVTDYGEDSLGIMATNPEYLKRHPDCEIEYYSLSAFNLTEWTIVPD